MKKLLVLLVFVFCLLALKGYAQDRWVYVCESGYSIAYYDTETIKYNNYNNSVTVYLKYVYMSDYSLETGVDYLISKETFYCKEYAVYTSILTCFYSDGRISTSHLNQKKDIIPESVSELIYKELCR